MSFIACLDRSAWLDWYVGNKINSLYFIFTLVSCHLSCVLSCLTKCSGVRLSELVAFCEAHEKVGERHG